MSRTLTDFLNSAGLKTAAATTTKKAAAKRADHSDVASDDNSQPTTEPEGGKDPRETHMESETQDTGKEASLTLAQKWLRENGVFVQDTKKAEFLFAQQMKLAELEKFSELEKFAEEERCRGAIFYQGMVKESTALRAALNQATVDDVCKVAYAMGIDPEHILKRAEEMAAAVHSADPALVGDHLGTAARVDSSHTTQAADENGATTSFRPAAVGQTRTPVSGDDPKLFRFTDIWTLPGNPGLNLGQAVDQGKGL